MDNLSLSREWWEGLERDREREKERERQKDTERETERQRKAQRELCLAVVTRYTFNFLTWKCMFHLSEHCKFEYF